MEKTLLTSCNKLRSLTNLSENIDEKYITVAIDEAQDMTLQPIIGTRLLNKICDLINTSAITADTNTYYLKVLQMSQYIIVYDAASRLCVTTSFKVANTGVNQTSDNQNNVQTVGMNDVFKMSQYYKDMAQFYISRLQNYLLEFYEYLPELGQKTISEMKANLYSSEDCGLWLGGMRGKGIDTPCCKRNGIDYDKY